MPQHNEPVAPAPFEAADANRQQPSAAASASNERSWVLPALALLFCTALWVFFWLPEQISSSPESTGPGSDEAASVPDTNASPKPIATSPAPAPAADPASPWADAQQARLRLESQDILAELIDLQFALEERGIKQWGPDVFAKAADLAEQGDVAYRNQSYAEATVQYRQSLDLLKPLFDQLPEKLTQLVVDAEGAIEKGDIDTATTSLATAKLIGPNDDRLPPLEARLEALPKVLELLAKARKSSDAGDLDSAQKSLDEALSLDPMHRATAQAIDRVRDAITERDFQTAMSVGYRHLAENEYASASAAFARAEALKPGSAEVASAQAEVNNASSDALLRRLQREGDRLEKNEQWAAAVENYSRALQVDDNLIYATEGLARSRARAELDEQFQGILEKPERLADEAIAAEASDFLRYARTVNPKGSLLQSQITALDTLLQQARTPIPITLNSDRETSVVVNKVARLGKFSQHELTLKPGIYTAVGSRMGYRDVRVDFTLRHGEPPQPVTIVCTEQI